MMPLFKNFRSTNQINAFLLASIYSTIVLSLTLLTHNLINKLKLNSIIHLLFSLFYVFIINILAYTIMYYSFDYGGGMLINKDDKQE